MTDTLAQELRATLAEELRDQVGAMREKLSALSTGAEPKKPLEALYRIAHTLKGASRAANVPAIEDTCVELEARVIAARDRGTRPDDQEIAWLTTVVDGLALAAESLVAGGAPESATPESSRAGPRLDAPRVLAVEDSPTQATKLRDALTRGGYAVVEARSGVEALSMVGTKPVDVVVSDVMMPGSVDGYELCRRVKRERPELPVLLLTSLSDPLDIIRGLEAGADSFLSKPYEPEHLRARLELLLANRRARESSDDGPGVAISFMGQPFRIESSREQVLDLLVTTFEDAVRQNGELKEAVRALEEAQEELARKERLAVLGKLSGSVGHELRNPLGVMTNAVYFLTMVIKDPPSQVTEYLGILKTQIALSEKIVSDLLDFARVKPPRLARTDVGAMIQSQLARVTVPQDVEVRVRVPETVPAVEVDATQVGQVLLNLISNGVQAMEEGGGVLTITAEPRHGRVLVAVEDTGPGVSEENRAKIFEPLFTTKARGIGLGLAVSRSLAEANGGALGLGTGAGTGARFELDLPVTASKP